MEKEIDLWSLMGIISTDGTQMAPAQAGRAGLQGKG